ncbi:MAG TPA: amidase family protein [Solirubrobacteraceae bacterium]
MTTITDDTVAFAGPAALAAQVRAGEVSPRELVELYLRRIERLNPTLNAFRAVLAEQALAEADQRLGHGGPLAGVPIAVKDDIAVAGQTVTRGSRSYGPPAAADSEVVRRLRAAGAIPVGITTTPELFIFPWTATEANGITRNPWNPERTTGGSSGGSGAAVAAGLVAAATGSDGGGSIRIPAASNGLVGMKPSRGRVSWAPNAPGWLGLSVLGALARTVSDSALMLDVLHGVGPEEPDPAPPFRGSYVTAATTPPGRLRIAVSRKPPPGIIAPVAADQRGAWERAAGLLSDLGHDVEDRDPDYGLVQFEFLQTWLRGVHEEAEKVPDRSRLEPYSRQMAAAGRLVVPPRRRRRLLERRRATTARILRLWDEFDVLLTPGTATTAIAAEGGFGRAAPVAINLAGRFTPFTATFNLTGQPAVVIPAGLGIDGLPLSVQLVGRPGAEDTLYSLAGQIERAAPWAHRRPVLAT